MSWSLSRNGRAIDLVNPSVEDVDFLEIADTLAHVYRWTGSAKHDVSVAWHTIIGVEIARWRKLDHAIPYWLLHDAHEARLGDIATPVAEAYASVIAFQIWSSTPGATRMEEIADRVRRAQSQMKLRHDCVLRIAAGLDTVAEGIIEAAVKKIDCIALMTERRDYMPASPRLWGDLEHVSTFPKPLGKPPPPAVCSERLYELFRQHLPALGGAPV
jgi:uncharacterized protein